MLDAWLAGPWDEAPTEMAFEAGYAEILEGLRRDLETMRGPESREAAADPGRAEARAEAMAAAARRVYLRAPALVNVALNYKICVEHGLPLHPTVYYELRDARRWRLPRPVSEQESANRLYRESIELARAAIRLEPDWSARAAAFSAKLPPELPGFIYTGGGDKYTWIGSEPAKLASLARKVLAAGGPDGGAEILVAAAHGSIMPALLLAEYLGLPLYFVRFSMFKRRDEEPILSLADEAWLSRWRESRALLYDEDVAGGTTLSAFRARLAPLFREVLTACSIRHAGSAFKPDLAAVTWWD